MNEFERRLIQLSQTHMDMAGIVQAMGRKALVEHFGYTIQLGSVASPLLSASVQSGLISMQSDAYFVLQYVMSCVVRPNIPQWFTDSGNVQLQLTDTGSGQVLYSTQSSAGAVTATVSRPQTGIPILLPVPIILPPNTNVKVDATQLGVNLTDNQEPQGFWLALMGSRVAQV